MPTKTVKKPAKVVLASQIVQKTITDLTKNPDRWEQENWSSDNQRYLSREEMDALEDERARSVFLKVRQPGDGMKNSLQIFGELEEVFHEPQRYCGLGGIRQNAYRLNKDSFWDKKFQKELATAGAYLEGEAATREMPRWEDMEDDEPTNHFNGFIEFNDHSDTTVKDVIALMRVVVKQLKAKESKDAEKAAAKAWLPQRRKSARFRPLNRRNDGK